MVNYLPVLWKDTCRIQISRKVTKENLATGFEWFDLVTDEPCKVSFYNNIRVNGPSADNGIASAVVQQTKLFIRPSLSVPAGSRITVTTHENNKTLYFESSGIPGIFTNHQEILIESVQKWA